MQIKNKVAQAINLALLCGSVSIVQHGFAQEQEAPAAGEVVEKINVTGSRIKRTEVEGPAPIVVITAASIKDAGFSTVFEAIQNITSNTGTQQGQGFGGFTQNAETVNLRGLGPNRTLVLLNGRRVANYPRPFNGENNVFNISSIPLAAVEQIEIIAGGQSAIYGSDAMAGVVNIITKTGVDETTITGGLTATAEGGGESQKFTFVTGGEADKLKWTLALDYSNQEMLRGKDRQWLDDRYDNPAHPADLPSYYIADSRTVMAMNYNYWTEGQRAGFKYLDPTQSCREGTHAAYRQNSGNYCSEDNTGFGSLMNERENVSAFLNGTYEINDNHSLSADFLYWNSKAKSLGSTFYDTRFALESTGVDGNGYIYTESANANNYAAGDPEIGTPTYIYMQRTFSMEEMGGLSGASNNYKDEMFSLSLVMDGTIFDDYDYEVYGSYSQSDNDERQYKLTEEGASNYFIGTEEGHDISQGIYLAYLKMDNVFGELTQEGFDQIFEQNVSGGTTKATSFGGTVSGDLFELPAGALQFAATAEWSKEEYNVNLHPRTLNREGRGWANLTGTEGSGSRDRYSAALEFNIPLHETLNLNAAARYDDYQDDTDVGGAGTYQVGLEWRPLDNLLVRSSYATTFKAPDLHQVNAEASGFFQGITDDWLAAVCLDVNAGGNGASQGLPGDALASAQATCSSANNWNPDYTVEGLRSGEKSLKEETGETLSVGFVWQPIDDISWSLDYYKVEMEDEVVSFPSTKLFEFEQECRNGTREASSGVCQNVVDNFITRVPYSATNPSPAGGDLQVDLLSSTYINAAARKQTGLESEFTYNHDFGVYGAVKAKINWTHVLTYERQYFIDDEIDKDYREVLGGDFRSKMNSSVEWSKGDWRITLMQNRFGSTTNDPQAGDFTKLGEVDENGIAELRRLKPWLIYNLGINYNVMSGHDVRLGVNNLRNSRPRSDASFDAYPYFDQTVYPTTIGVAGRTYTLDYSMTF